MYPPKVIESLDDFWQLFDNLCFSLRLRNQSKILHNLEDAKSWVDNFHDEWFEFSYSLDYILERDNKSFTDIELSSLIKLQNYLDDYLRERYNA